jgi:hypothetical protein
MTYEHECILCICIKQGKCVSCATADCEYVYDTLTPLYINIWCSFVTLSTTKALSHTSNHLNKYDFLITEPEMKIKEQQNTESE